MLDATGKVPSGILQGNTHWFGRYDQCRSLKADDSHEYNGGYCLTTLTPYKPGALIPVRFHLFSLKASRGIIVIRNLMIIIMLLGVIKLGGAKINNQ